MTEPILSPGQSIELDIERPAAGGRMIARHDGRIILVAGAIPGERVAARVDRVDKRLAFAAVEQVLDASGDRRPVSGDPLCGGCTYAHIAYPRQVALKGEVIADAYRRLGRIPVDDAVPVEPSAELGYRMRARLHVKQGRAGFVREGTHQLCDPGQTGQLTAGTLDAVRVAIAAMAVAGDPVIAAVDVTENMAGDERAIHFELGPGASIRKAALKDVAMAAGLRGCSAGGPSGTVVSSGDARVSDPVAALTAGRGTGGALERSPESFFQGNRYLLPALVNAVADAVPVDGAILDLYAGVGLFSVTLAAMGRQDITAVEGDRASGADLRRNSAALSGVYSVIGRVEDYLARAPRSAAGTVIVDPPRTGISRDAMAAIVRSGAARIVYVSCDPPTMARDARRLLDAGYTLASLHGFDLFPNTPHVETLAVFVRGEQA